MVATALAPRRRLVVPATRVFPREELFAATPAFLRPGAAPPAADVAPPLLSFEGDTFVEELNAAATRDAPLPDLLAWRDWAEPPSSMIAASRATFYGATIRRTPPLAIAAEATGGLDADGVPSASPAWLRKLYLPLHLRFTYLAFDLICHKPGFPRVARGRVKGSGVIVRRLVRDASRERWEDWVSADGRRGLWFELAGGLPADPDAIPAAAWGTRETEIRARLGMSAAVAMPAIDRAAMAPLPDTGAALTLAGLVPVFSAAEQAGDDQPGLSEAQLAQQLADGARAALAEAWADDAAIRARTSAAARDFLDRTILPPAPTTLQLNAARASIAASGLDPDAQMLAAVRIAMTRALALLAPGAGDSAALPTTAAFWTSGGAQAPSLAGDDLPPVNFLRAPTADWNVCVVARLHAIADRICAPAGGVAADDDEARALMTLGVLRLRRCRIALLASLYGQSGEGSVPLTGTAPQLVDGVTYQLPRTTAGSAGDEIALLLGLDAVRAPAESAPDFPPLSTLVGGSGLAIDVHRAGVALEASYGPIEEAGTAGGSAFAEQLKSHEADAAGQLAAYFGAGAPAVATLRAAGLDLREQPASGLVLFPGPSPRASDFGAMTSATAAAYEGAAHLASARQEVRARSRVKRLRFDHDSIYAAWGFVRVAGRSGCEPDRIVWTRRSEPFTIAEPTDILGMRPVTIQMPDIPKLIRDMPRIARARARPFSSFVTPRNSAISAGAEPAETRRQWGIGWICSFGIPVVTICAFVLFSIIFSILIAIPGFAWMLFLKFCLPVPAPKKGG